MVEDNLIFVDEFEVRLNRKDVKALRMRVASDGHVELSMPRRATRAQAEAFVRARADWMQEAMRESPMAQADRAEKEEVEAWRGVVGAVVPGLVEKWAPIMGVRVGKLAYRNMRSRWGSCQPETGRICINIRLALYPPECLEYVVVHELCHLIVPAHGPKFWAEVEKYLPNWRQAAQKLKK